MIQPSSWEVLPGLPPYGEVFTFHRDEELFVREGMVVKFTTGERAWVGNFAPGDVGITSVFVLGASAIVVVKGVGYRVDIGNPSRYSTIRPGVVYDACLIETLDLLVLAGAVSVSGYGAEGLRWISPELSTDGVRLQACSGTAVTGVAERHEGKEPHYFSIDPRTGSTEIKGRYP